MKVLVTNPPWPGVGYGARSDVRWPHKRKDKYIEYPIYLAYIISILEKSGIDVEFIDAIVEELSISKFVESVEKIKPDIAIIECSTPSIDYDLTTAKELKEKMEDLFIVLIGSHPTVFHREILRENKCVDAICRGEFDLTVRDIVLSLSNGEDLRKVRGISYRDGKEIRVNEDRPLIQDLDQLPFPARHIVKNENYRAAIYTGKNPTALVSSRGCPYGCIYCLWPRTLYGRKFRSRSPENVVDEIEEVVKKYGVDEIYFDDDCLTLGKKRMMDICRLIIERDLDVKWICQCRVDTVDRELLKEMKKAGCHYILFGVESGSQKMLDYMKKGITLDKVREAFKLCKELGIKTQAFFLIGLPGENHETIKETMKFAKEIEPASAQFAVVIPHPGTELYKICKEKGWLVHKLWGDFDACNSLIETDELSREEVEKYRIQAYREFYIRPSFILKTAFNIRSKKDIKRIYKGGRSIIERMSFFKEASSEQK